MRDDVVKKQCRKKNKRKSKNPKKGSKEDVRQQMCVFHELLATTCMRMDTAHLVEAEL